MNKRITAALAAFLVAIAAASGQNPSKEFKETCDSLVVKLQERTSVKGAFSVKKTAVSDNKLHIRFSPGFGEYPWRKGDIEWLRKKLKAYLPARYKNYEIGNITVNGTKLEDYIVTTPGSDGTPDAARFKTKDHRGEVSFISSVGGQDFQKGLTGRNIALWQSHGRYYDEGIERWDWQRGPLFQTVEDMYTQTYVLTFLIPMLENAGAYVMTPRERDPQRNEVVADNDIAFQKGRGDDVRLEGGYSESGRWKDAGTGFADAKAAYSKDDNPFLMGTARKVSCRDEEAKAVWTADIPERGEYAVYISYKSLPESSPCAHYSVRHLGGKSEFTVNQRIGGGTWIYLGTFEFDRTGSVTLDTQVPEGCECPDNAVITADAVRFGGGMGKIARGPADRDASEYETSGMPSFAEGAIYWMQWAGADSTLMHLHEGDYTKDYGTRGAWVGWMSGGSRTNPKAEGLGIPVDMSLALHSDAGITPNDSIVGTLAIYTLKCEDSEKLPNGEGRLQARTLTDYVQSQIVDDIRSTCNPLWSRRGIWDKSYSESRTSTVPATLIEILSHQNFADMKYGLDPSFRFVASRAMYKAMLRFLSARYGCEYVVQPLPVNSFATSFCNDAAADGKTSVTLSWKPTEDKIESTAMPTGYILYTRIDNGGFDNGVILEDVTTSGGRVSTTRQIEPGHIYSYRIVAFNEGGKSFPSNVLSVGVPERGRKKCVLVVDAFSRVAAPSWMDSPEIAGFDSKLDAGVAYGQEIGFVGEQYQFRRDMKWTANDNPGFGGSYTDMAGVVFAGNRFDNTCTHGKAILSSGYAFHSASSDAFASIPSIAAGDFAVDMVCGKQISTVVGRKDGPVKYTIFTEPVMKAITDFCAKGGDILISGSYIGTDAWSQIYPFTPDEASRTKMKEFIQNTLGYKWVTNYATRKGEVWPMTNSAVDMASRLGKVSFHQERNPRIYNVETPDGIVPSSKDSHTILRYSDTNISAATLFRNKGYKAACFGFPIETLCNEEDIENLIEMILNCFDSE